MTFEEFIDSSAKRCDCPKHRLEAPIIELISARTAQAPHGADERTVRDALHALIEIAIAVALFSTSDESGGVSMGAAAERFIEVCEYEIGRINIVGDSRAM